MAGVEIQEAIRCRILELAAQRKWSVNKLAERSGIAPSVLKRTVKSYATVQRTSVEPVCAWGWKSHSRNFGIARF